jgi:UDP-3-O-[3-hydroxymyristoyl] glucosamine N-acyltransferase
MQFTAAQIALLINGRTEGDPSAAVTGFGKIEEAQKGQISFLANPKYEEYLYTSSASIIIINENLETKQAVAGTLIRVPDAYTAFATLLTKYQELMTQQLSGVQEPSYIAKSVKMGEQVFVGAFSYLGENVIIGNNVKIFQGVVIGDNVQIGDNTVLHPGVKIYHDCTIGSHAVLHAGVVIGADGFGFAPQPDGGYKKIPQIGNVIIEDFVEIGANTTIDRATMGATIIRKGVKLDNLIQIGHNVEIGSDTVIAALTGISGSTKIGKNVMMGGQVGLVGHITIADGTKIAGKSGLMKSVKEPNTSLIGTPAMDVSLALRSQVVIRNLPDLEKRVADLEKLVRQLLSERINA